ncbi:MAG TPA: biosynthetic peptidoglycan transglycosylase [Polyangiaceae bacterium]|nr:biosynthetic peptidoglycan transglycosylase [Polyangiaceae bacterium]
MRLGTIRRGPAVAGLLVVAVAVALAIALALFPGIVRARVIAAARRRHIHLRVGSAHLEPWGVRLRRLVAGLDDVEGVELQASELDVHLAWSLRLERVALTDAEISLTGSESALSDRLTAWRVAGHESAAPEPRTTSDLEFLVRGLAIRWKERREDTEPQLEATGVSVDSEPHGARIAVGAARFRAGPLVIAASAASAILGGGTISRARADALTVTWNLPGDDGRSVAEPGFASNAVADPVAVAPVPAAPSPVAAASRKHARIDPPALESERTVAWALPDVRSFRAKTAIAATFLRDRLSPAADIGVDALVWKIDRPDERIALTIGPGPLAVERTASGLEARFSTSSAGSGAPALSFRIFLPTDEHDATIGLEGGPVSLALLGVRDGAFGLTDVRVTTVNGRAQLSLAGDGSSLTFDAEGDARGLALRSARLAPEVVRGLDVQLRARGVLDAASESAGELRIDDFAAQLGAIQFDGSGLLRQAPAHVVGGLRFEIPSTTCQRLLDSVPAALLPVLQGMKVGGTFGMAGRVAFDTQRLDDLKLDYDIKDSCTVTEVPESLSPDQFQRPFVHRIYLPDGLVGDQLTGPGSSNWTPLDQISPYMQVAVLTTEDGAFRKHHGFNRASIRASIIANLKARRFVRGASTITMQLAKNLFLAREKTMARKLEEVVLTEYLEQSFSKDELMELYLNVIEFGPSIYGITAAADYYFGRTPAELNLAECLFLASLLPSPLRYGAMRDAGSVPEGWMRLLRGLISTAHDFGRITDVEMAEALRENVVFWRSGERPQPRLPVHGRPQLEGQSDEDLGIPASDAPEDSP